MNLELILGIVIILVVAAVVILAARIYQREREKTGYHQGRYYRRNQHIGAFLGNYFMNKDGMGDENSDGRIETDEEMFLFSDKE